MLRAWQCCCDGEAGGGCGRVVETEAWLTKLFSAAWVSCCSAPVRVAASVEIKSCLSVGLLEGREEQEVVDDVGSRR